MKCYICNNLGFVLYKQDFNGIEYEFIAHCTCPKGANYAYDGRTCTKNKSKYYVESVEKVLPIDFLIEHNKKLEAKYANEAEVRQKISETAKVILS